MSGMQDDDDQRRSVREALFETERKAGESLSAYATRRISEFAAGDLAGRSLSNRAKTELLEEGSKLAPQGGPRTCGA